MKVVHISTSDRGSGAASAAYRLHHGLRALGCASTMFVADVVDDEPEPTVTRFEPPRDLPTRLRRRLRRLQIAGSLARYTRPPHAEAFSDDRGPHGRELVDQVPACDIMHVHAMLRFVDYRAFFAVAPYRAPIVRTMHDMSFFTGGCHYDAGCGKYRVHCGACPQLGSHVTRDLSYAIWERKRSAFSAIPPDRLALVAPSRWLAGEAERSGLLRGLPVTVIPLGLDTQIFHPIERGFARSVLGLPPDASIVLFVAEPLSRANKGFADLAEALNGMERRELFLLSAGSGRPPVEVRTAHRHLGRLPDQRLLAIVYSAADLFVIPSLQDNAPQTAIEALACGVPAVGYDTCGIPEIVRPGVTGALVPPKNVGELRNAIEGLLDDDGRRARLAANCRRVAVEEYSVAVCARRHIALYETILGSGRVFPPAGPGAPARSGAARRAEARVPADPGAVPAPTPAAAHAGAQDASRNAP
jgi:glycosyltransferase involved in cell wall biosynthesis